MLQSKNFVNPRFVSIVPTWIAQGEIAFKKTVAAGNNKRETFYPRYSQ